jgi:hypothetical protein
MSRPTTKKMFEVEVHDNENSEDLVRKINEKAGRCNDFNIVARYRLVYKMCWSFRVVAYYVTDHMIEGGEFPVEAIE